MDPNDLKDWQLCWHANLLFHKCVTKPQKCIVCSEIHNYADDTRRSTFWLDATRCSAGHRQATQIETRGTPNLGVCATCDQMYMFDVVKGKHTCRREGCRRIVSVHELSLREKLESDKVLLEYVCIQKTSTRRFILLTKSQQLPLPAVEIQSL
jgi:hypothetical protein